MSNINALAQAVPLNPLGAVNPKLMSNPFDKAQLMTDLAAAKSAVSSPAGTQHAALVKAANNFEAQLMQELMKPLSAKAPLFSDSANGAQDDDGESGGVLESYGNEALAQALAANGGLGIGRMVVKQVEGQMSRNASTTTKVAKRNTARD